MRKVLFLLFSLIVSLPLVASDHASGISLESVSGKATATVVLDYRNDFARIGFTSAEVSSDDFAAKSEISEAVLKKDSSKRAASSEGTAIWCFWQINNSSKFNVKLSSDGVKSSGGSIYDNWIVSIGETLKISGSGDKSTVIKEKTGASSESGSCSLAITVSDYPSMPADNYVLPLVLTLESV